MLLICLGIFYFRKFGSKFGIFGRFGRIQEARLDKPFRPCRGTIVLIGEGGSSGLGCHDKGFTACRGGASQRAVRRDKACRCFRDEVSETSFFDTFDPDLWCFELKMFRVVPRGHSWDFVRFYSPV